MTTNNNSETENLLLREGGYPHLPQPKTEVQQEQQEPEKSEKAWCEWVATMIGAYLNEPVDSDKCKAIAGIIERRLWGFPKTKRETQQEPIEIGEVHHFAQPYPYLEPAHVEVFFSGTPPAHGTKVYVLPPAPEGGE